MAIAEEEEEEATTGSQVFFFFQGCLAHLRGSGPLEGAIEVTWG